jgi:putative ABC transport system ATP-binding protein
MRMLKELHEKGNTIILITHDNDIAMQAKRVVRIQDGQINEDRMVG